MKGRLIGSITSFRSIKWPFHSGISTKVIAAIVFTIYSLALISSFDKFYFSKYVPYEDKEGQKIEYCGSNESLAMYVSFTSKTALLMTFVPLTVIVTIQILSYRAITKSADQFNFDAVRIRTMHKVRSTFIKVTIAFFTLVTPASAYLMIFNYLMYICDTSFCLQPQHRELFVKLREFFDWLLSVNSIVNPFIYAKIQRRFRQCRHFRQCSQFFQSIRQSDLDRRGFDNRQGHDQIELQQM